jgi:hypothetical protein
MFVIVVYVVNIISEVDTEQTWQTNGLKVDVKTEPSDVITSSQYGTAQPNSPQRELCTSFVTDH